MNRIGCKIFAFKIFIDSCKKVPSVLDVSLCSARIHTNTFYFNVFRYILQLLINIERAL